MGVGQAVASNPTFGMQQAARLLSREGLAVVGRDGRLVPQLAQSLKLSNGGLTLEIDLRSRVTFHDKSPVNAAAVKASLKETLASLGPIANDVRSFTEI